MTIRDGVSRKEIMIYDILHYFDQFLTSKPSSFMRIVYESTAFGADGEQFMGVETLKDFVARTVFQLHPFIKNFSEDKLWNEYFGKYSLMVKETLTNALRNVCRQKRGISRLLNDLNILISEGNYTDDTLLNKKKIRVTETNTTGL